jgi:hypothetical protein
MVADQGGQDLSRPERGLGEKGQRKVDQAEDMAFSSVTMYPLADQTWER